MQPKTPELSSKNYTITLTQGLLDEISTSSELAFVLAHEMGHIELEHLAPVLSSALLTQTQLRRIAQVHQDWEIEADGFALKRILDAGYDPRAGIELLSRLELATEIDAEAEFSHHPDPRSRMLLLNTPEAISTKNKNDLALSIP